METKKRSRVGSHTPPHTPGGSGADIEQVDQVADRRVRKLGGRLSEVTDSNCELC